jgi:tRNA (adenine57-N1/adenine58-N1)-methyltransferase
MERQPFTSIEVMEVFERMYKPVPARLRPADVMVGHTGFLVFARKVAMMEPAETDEEEDEADAAPDLSAALGPHDEASDLG